MIHVAGLALAMIFGTMSQAAAQTQSAPPACGAKLEGAGTSLEFASPLPEDDRIGLLASVHLALNDSTGRGAWPISEIDIAPPCEIASFPVGDDTWVISAGEGYAPPRWARARGRDETYYLTAGPSVADARAWSTTPGAPATGLARPLYYLVGAADGLHFVFKVYQGAPGGKQLADDLVEAITEKTAPVAVYDSRGNAASLFLLTRSRRTSWIYQSERLTGDRSAVLYGPDGVFFFPAPRQATILRGSDLQCDARYGTFELWRLGVLNPDDRELHLACFYYHSENYLSIFSSRLPDASDDRRVFASLIKSAQDEDGVSARLPGFETGAREILQAGRAWVDKSGMGQGIWLMRRGEYVYEIRITFEVSATKAALDAVEAFALSTEPEPVAR